MTDPIRIRDLDADRIKAALCGDGSEITDEQAAAISDFIDSIGGIENAMLAVEMLKDLDEAA
jgi:hypothetical protein